jgi:soluble epoxide hydrolase / lipid-phosphate phosphatase
VVLLHGWPDLWYGWRRQIAPLAAAGFRVLVPDQRGFGGTDAPADLATYGTRTLTNDIAALLDHLGIARAVVIGHDWYARPL